MDSQPAAIAARLLPGSSIGEKLWQDVVAGGMDDGEDALHASMSRTAFSY